MLKNAPDCFIILYSDIPVIVFQVALRGFLVILALSLHAIFEGMAVGLTQKVCNTNIQGGLKELKYHKH